VAECKSASTASHRFPPPKIGVTHSHDLIHAHTHPPSYISPPQNATNSHQTHRSNNQLFSTKFKMPSKKATRTPGRSHYDPADGSGPGGWHFNAWLLRRSLKIGPTSQTQDLVRCYEAMTPGMYKVNLDAKKEIQTQTMRYLRHQGWCVKLRTVMQPMR
jgi:hypothetical protein